MTYSGIGGREESFTMLGMLLLRFCVCFVPSVFVEGVRLLRCPRGDVVVLGSGAFAFVLSSTFVI